MKKFLILLLLPAGMLLQFCSSSKKKASAPTAVKTITFETDVKPIVTAKCAPCHTVGKKSHIDNLAIAKEEIDDIIKRISMAPAEHGFMPMKGEKLSDAEIQVFVQWKASGLLEK